MWIRIGLIDRCDEKVAWQCVSSCVCILPCNASTGRRLWRKAHGAPRHMRRCERIRVETQFASEKIYHLIYYHRNKREKESMVIQTVFYSCLFPSWWWRWRRRYKTQRVRAKTYANRCGCTYQASAEKRNKFSIKNYTYVCKRGWLVNSFQYFLRFFFHFGFIVAIAAHTYDQCWEFPTYCDWRTRMNSRAHYTLLLYGFRADSECCIGINCCVLLVRATRCSWFSAGDYSHSTEYIKFSYIYISIFCFSLISQIELNWERIYVSISTYSSRFLQISRTTSSAFHSSPSSGKASSRMNSFRWLLVCVCNILVFGSASAASETMTTSVNEASTRPEVVFTGKIVIQYSTSESIKCGSAYANRNWARENTHTYSNSTIHSVYWQQQYCRIARMRRVE